MKGEWFFRLIGIAFLLTTALGWQSSESMEAAGYVIAMVLICTAAILQAIGEGRSK